MTDIHLCMVGRCQAEAGPMRFCEYHWEMIPTFIVDIMLLADSLPLGNLAREEALGYIATEELYRGR